MNLFKVWKTGSALRLASDMAYRENFIVTTIGNMLRAFIGPLIILLIYSASSGIPGWSLHEFLLFQGTLTIVFGLGHTFFVGVPLFVIRALEKGAFDRYLVKPINTLTYLTATCFDWDGLGELFAGLIIISIAFIKLNLTIVSVNFLIYLLLILFAALFQYTVMIVIAATSFLVVRAWALFDLYFKASDFARYPLGIYAPSLVFIFTFLFPIAISAFYPAEALLHGLSILTIIKIIIPILVLYTLSLIYWKLAMRKYTSAGG